MQEFIPLEDDWLLLEMLSEQRLVPYQAGMPCVHRARPEGRDTVPLLPLRSNPAGHSSWPRDLG